MYLAKAEKMAESTEPQGIPEKLIYAAFMQACTRGNDAEIQQEYEEAIFHYTAASKYLSKLYKDAIHGGDKMLLSSATESVQVRIASVSSMIAQ